MPAQFAHADQAHGQRAFGGQAFTGVGHLARHAGRHDPGQALQRTQVGGHATLFRARDKAASSNGLGVFAPLKPPLDRIHQELKQAFDPFNLMNPGKLLGPVTTSHREDSET